MGVNRRLACAFALSAGARASSPPLQTGVKLFRCRTHLTTTRLAASTCYFSIWRRRKRLTTPTDVVVADVEDPTPLDDFTDIAFGRSHDSLRLVDGRKTAGELANVVRFAFATGWRTASEVLPLEWRHVDWQARTVRLDPGTTKNEEGRSFPFTAAIEKILKDQLAIHETLKKAGTICPYVFHRDGERIVYFRAAWMNACKAAGCPGALVHDMRRSAVRTFERASVPRSVAMSIVGHKTESIYRRYAIVDEAMQREAAVRLDAWLGAPRAASSTGSVAALDRRRRPRRRTMA
jgi:integrase